MTYEVRASEDGSAVAWVPRLGTQAQLPADRAAVVRGLFELAAWVCDHPELPLPHVTARVGSGFHGWPVVDQVAVALGSEPVTGFDGRRYEATGRFGSVRLSCVAYGPRVLRRAAGGGA